MAKLNVEMCREIVPRSQWGEESLRRSKEVSSAIKRGGWTFHGRKVTSFTRREDGSITVVTLDGDDKTSLHEASYAKSVVAVRGLGQETWLIELKVVRSGREVTWSLVNGEAKARHESLLEWWEGANDSLVAECLARHENARKREQLLARLRRVLDALADVQKDQVEVDSDDSEMPVFKISFPGKPPVLISIGETSADTKAAIATIIAADTGNEDEQETEAAEAAAS